MGRDVDKGGRETRERQMGQVLPDPKEGDEREQAAAEAAAAGE